jgi:amino acid transporter
MTARTGLDRRSIGTSALFFFVVGASAPMTVLAGGVVATYAATGVVGVPLSFLVLGAALALFTVGYIAMGRHVQHAATFFAFLARGLGGIGGMAGGAVALVAYNCIQISLYGLLGATVSGFIGGAWWLWSLLALVIVAVLGVLHIRINARVLAALLICELAIILLLDLASFTHPAHGLDLRPLSPGSLFVNGLGGVFALGIAAFVGYESGPVYAEEARGRRTVARATFGGLAFVSVLYALSSWAMADTIGTQASGAATGGAPEVVASARDQGAGLPFAILDQHLGGVAAGAGKLLLITSIVAAMLSFHNTVARYVYGMARDGVLPATLGTVRGGSGGGAPVAGSLLQTAIAAVIVIAFAVTGADPLAQLFTWLSTIAAIGVLLLMVGTCVAVVAFFHDNPSTTGESAWHKTWAPLLGAVALTGVLLVTVVNISTLLNSRPGSPLPWVLTGIVLLATGIGVVWGVALRTSKPEVYARIGVGEAKPLALLSYAYTDVKL